MAYTQVNVKSNSYGKYRIQSCTCKHGYQDSQFGLGKRYHTLSTKNRNLVCTVCGTTKNLPNDATP